MDNIKKPLVIILSSDFSFSEKLVPVFSTYFEPLVFYNIDELFGAYDLVHINTKCVLIDDSSDEWDILSILKQMRSISMIPNYIILSDSYDINNAIQSFKSGAYRYILKPIQPNQLVSIVKSGNARVDAFSQLEALAKYSYLSVMNSDDTLASTYQLLLDRRLAGDIIRLEDIMSLCTGSEIESDQFLKVFERELNTISSPLLTPKKTILIIEDDEIIQESLMSLLEDKYTLIIAGNGEEARRYLSQSQYIDVILLDIYLPDIKGYDLLPIISQMHPETSVIVLTAYRDLDIVIQCMENGAKDYLNKPFYEVELMTTIASVLQQAYFDYLLPKFKDILVEKNVSYRLKLQMLSSICHQRMLESKPIYMRDLYQFFPELKASYVPDEVVLPESILSDGIIPFIETIQSQLTQK